MLEADEGTLGFLRERLSTEGRGMHIITCEVVRATRLLVDGLLLTDDLVTDLMRHIAFVIQNHVLLSCDSTTIIMIMNWSKITLSVAPVADHN